MLLEAPVEAPPLDRPQVHRLAEGTELLGEYRGSGFQEPRFLIRRSDGQVLQLPLLLYRVAGSLDGRHDDGELAADLAGELGMELEADQISFLVEEKLRPVGLVAAGSADVAVDSALPVRPDLLLALRYRVGVIPQYVVWHLARPFGFLFRRPVWIGALVALVVLEGTILAAGDVSGRALSGVQQIVGHPWLVVMLLLVELAAAAFHETGHVTACRYGGARPGDMGVGLYLVWPAFYSTVTDSYRLDRIGRLRTDLGGVYFNAISLAGLAGAYLLSGEPWLLLALFALQFETVWQFLPSIRLDGYYMLADLAGVPDLFGYVRPALTSLLPGRPMDPRLRGLRPWPRRVIVGWVVVTIPTLLFYLVAFLLVLPRALAVAARELGGFLSALETAVHAGQVPQVIYGVFDVLLLLLPWLGTVMITATIAGRLRRAAVTRWGRGRLPSGTWAGVRRGASLVAVAGLAGLVVLRTGLVGSSLPASPAEARLTDGAFGSLIGAPSTDSLGGGDLLGRQLVAYSWLTGAFGRHPDVLGGGRELAAVSAAVLVMCLLIFSARRRVRLLAVTLPLVAVLAMGPAVAALAPLTAAVVGSAWTAVGLLVLSRHRHRHQRYHGRLLTAVGAMTLAVGMAVCPLVLVPLGAGTAVLVARGTFWGGRPPAWRAGAVLLIGATGVTATVASVYGDGAVGRLLPSADRTVLLLVAALISAIGLGIVRVRPWAAAASASVVLSALPWSGADGALPLVVVTAVPLGVLVGDALAGVPVAERPHPLIRAGLAIPVLVVTVVGALFVPPTAPTTPHAALAAWMSTPGAPTEPLAVPAGVWGDLLRDGVSARRLRLQDTGNTGVGAWAVLRGSRGGHDRAVARFGSGPEALTVWGPRVVEENPVAAQHSARRAALEGARVARLERQALGQALAASPRLNGPAGVLEELQTGEVDVRVLRGLAELTATHRVWIGGISVAAGETPSTVLPHAVLVTRFDGRPATEPAIVATLRTWPGAPGAQWAPATITPDASGMVAVW